MTVKELAGALGAAILTPGLPETEVTGCSCGDLLSWMMSRVREGDVWLTVMGNINAVGVAALTDCACVVLTYGAPLDDNARLKAQENDICVMVTDLSTYDAAVKIKELLG